MTSRPNELRPTRITDVRKAAKDGRAWVPSVTTILNVLAKDNLVNWKIGEHLKQAFKADRSQFNHDQEFDYISEIKRLTEIEMDKAPSAGTDFHKLMEMAVLNMEMSTEDHDLCNSVYKVIVEKTDGGCRWSPELNFVSGGYGGQIDLSNNDWVIDYKTKQTAEKFKPSKMVYDDHSRQLAAYRQAVSPKARCANVFVCLEDGQIDFHEHTEKQLQKGWGVFSHALEIWNIQNKA